MPRDPHSDPEGPDDADADLLDDDAADTRPCPGCGADIYADAERCPACGEYLTASGGSRAAWASRPWWWVLLALAGIAAFVLFFAL